MRDARPAELIAEVVFPFRSRGTSQLPTELLLKILEHVKHKNDRWKGDLAACCLAGGMLLEPSRDLLYQNVVFRLTQSSRRSRMRKASKFSSLGQSLVLVPATTRVDGLELVLGTTRDSPRPNLKPHLATRIRGITISDDQFEMSTGGASLLQLGTCTAELISRIFARCTSATSLSISASNNWAYGGLALALRSPRPIFKHLQVYSAVNNLLSEAGERATAMSLVRCLREIPDPTDVLIDVNSLIVSDLKAQPPAWRLASLHIVNLNRSAMLNSLTSTSRTTLQTLHITAFHFDFDISAFVNLKTLILVTPLGDSGRSQLYDHILASAPPSLARLSLSAVNLLSQELIPFPLTLECLYINLLDGVRKGRPAPPPDRPAFVGLLDFLSNPSSPLKELQFEVNDSGYGLFRMEPEPVGYTPAMRSALEEACQSGGVRVVSELKLLPVVELSNAEWKLWYGTVRWQ